MLGFAPPTTTSTSPESKADMATGEDRMETSSTERFCFLKKPASAAAHSGKKTTAAEGYAIRTVSAATAAEPKKTTSKQTGQLAVNRFLITFSHR
jgi:hypothetical protein